MAATNPRLGIDHVTVVPTNLRPEDVEDADGDTGDAGDGSTGP